MSYGQISGVSIPVSRIVLGSMILNIARLSDSLAFLDFYLERGGNCIDTAWIYGQGGAEKCVGTWIEQRGVREKMVLIGKGGAPIEFCTPATISSQLMDSLERLRTKYVDIYLLHRDNPSIPVGEFLDCLNDHYKAGRIRCFGGSNWTIERIEEANAYARAHHLCGFVASSPNFSLARWNEPTWTDCITATDEASRRWYKRTGMAVFAWSSQAGGFFSGRYNKNEPVTPEKKDMARIWFNEANFKRLERAQELARRKGFTATQVALAYVLWESPNTFALVGPENLDELRQSIEAAQLVLSPAERCWLNLESDSLL